MALYFSSGPNLQLGSGDNTNLPSSGQLTAAAWVLVDSAPGSGATRAVIARSGRSGSTNQGWSFGVKNNGGTLEICLRKATASPSAVTVPLGVWVGIAASNDSGNAPAFTLYQNGKLTTGAPADTTAITSPGTPKSRIGADNMAASALDTNFFVGKIAVVAVWNVALTTSELKQWFETGYNSIEPVAYYVLDGAQTRSLDIIRGVHAVNTTASSRPRHWSNPRTPIFPASAITEPMLWKVHFRSQVISSGGLSLSLSDDMSGGWADSIRIGYGNAVTDQLTLSDGRLIGYGGTTSDSMSMSDSAALVLEVDKQLSDAMSMSDSIAVQLNIAVTVADSLNNWSDGLAAGYGAAVSDQLVMSDSDSIGYGLVYNEQLVFTDGVAAGYGVTLADQLSFSDALALQFSIAVTVADQLPMSDGLAAGYGLGIGEALILTDAGAVGYGLTLSDQLTMSDSVVVLSSSPELTLSLVDQLVISDSLAVGYGLAANESLTLSDALGAQYGLVISDQLTLTDAVAKLMSFEFACSDTLNSWLDARAIGYGLGFGETFTLSDSDKAGYGLLISDQMVMSDSISLDTGSAVKQLDLSDSMSMSDGLGAGYGMGTSDQVTLADSLGAGYGMVNADQLASMADALIRTTSLEKPLSDAMPIPTELVQLLVGYQLACNDSLSQWQDLLQALQHINLALQDSDSSWAESVLFDFWYLLQVNDQLVFSDLLQFTAGNQLVLLLSDDESTNWLDALLTQLGRGFGAVNAKSVSIDTYVNAESIEVAIQVLQTGYGDVTVVPYVDAESVEIETQAKAVTSDSSTQADAESIEVQ